MREPVSALGGATFRGLVEIEDRGGRGMISFRGDLAAPALRETVAAVTGAEMPGPLGASFAGEAALLWMAPDELLVEMPRDGVADALARIEAALSGTHYLALDVSDARAVLRLSGASVREVLAKLTPADVSAAALPVGFCRRTRLAQVPAVFWFRDAETADLVCFRSVASYVFALLSNAARPDAAVGYF